MQSSQCEAWKIGMAMGVAMLLVVSLGSAGCAEKSPGMNRQGDTYLSYLPARRDVVAAKAREVIDDMGWIYLDTKQYIDETVHYARSTHGAKIRIAADEEPNETTQLKVTIAPGADETVSRSVMTRVEAKLRECGCGRFPLTAPDPASTGG